MSEEGVFLSFYKKNKTDKEAEVIRVDADFARYLEANFPDDLQILKKDTADESTYTYILGKHRATYLKWRSIPGYVKAMYFDRIPAEVLNGNVSVDTFVINAEAKFSNGEIIQPTINYDPFKEGFEAYFNNKPGMKDWPEENLIRLYANHLKRESYIESHPIGVTEEYLKTRFDDRENIAEVWCAHNPEKMLFALMKNVDRKIKRDKGNIIGFGLPDGQVVDVNGDVCGRIDDNGYLVGEDGVVLGKKTGSLLVVVDEKGETVGYVDPESRAVLALDGTWTKLVWDEKDNSVKDLVTGDVKGHGEFLVPKFEKLSLEEEKELAKAVEEKKEENTEKDNIETTLNEIKEDKKENKDDEEPIDEKATDKDDESKEEVPQDGEQAKNEKEVISVQELTSQDIATAGAKESEVEAKEDEKHPQIVVARKPKGFGGGLSRAVEAWKYHRRDRVELRKEDKDISFDDEDFSLKVIAETAKREVEARLRPDVDEVDESLSSAFNSAFEGREVKKGSKGKLIFDIEEVCPKKKSWRQEMFGKDDISVFDSSGLFSNMHELLGRVDCGKMQDLMQEQSSKAALRHMSPEARQCFQDILNQHFGPLEVEKTAKKDERVPVKEQGNAKEESTPVQEKSVIRERDVDRDK